MDEEEEQSQEIEPEDDENNDDKIAYLQTKKSLEEAVAEQKILKEKLTTLEARNKPAKWGRPLFIQSVESTRGRFDDSEATPEILLSELKKATHMLENAKRASETARAEQRDLLKQINELKVTATEETETLLKSNAKHHKTELLSEQLQFRKQQMDWNTEKADLLSESECLAMVSHETVHKTTEAREFVEGQRKRIQALANELRGDLTKSKELRDQLDDTKCKIALIDNLIQEIDANKRQADNLTAQIKEQKQILRAVRISAQAKLVLEDLASQTTELVEAKENAERSQKEAKEELTELVQNEKNLKQDLAQAQENFKQEQMEVFVIEAEIRDLNIELNNLKSAVIEEGRKNVELQRYIREEKIDATMRYMVLHSNEIHRVNQVHSTLMKVRDSFQQTGSNLPPLRSATELSKK